MRRDRDGEPIEDDDAPLPEHICDRGWLDEDSEGRPRPCLICKPALTERYRRPGDPVSPIRRRRTFRRSRSALR